MLIVPESDEQLDWLRIFSAEAASYHEQSVATLGTAPLETPQVDRQGPRSSPSSDHVDVASQGSSNGGAVATGNA